VVLEQFADVERMVNCMPGASIEGRDEEGNFLGVMLVAFGPKKIRFRGKVSGEVDVQARTGQLHVRGGADLKSSARIEVHVQYTMREDATAASPESIVSLRSDAKLGGVLADFGRTGGIAVTNALMETFAKRVAEEFSRDAGLSSESQAPTISAADLSSNRPAARVAFSTSALLLTLIKARLVAFFDWLGGWRTRH
jgi:carbon monoxide dehydrogenase subunit G